MNCSLLPDLHRLSKQAPGFSVHPEKLLQSVVDVICAVDGKGIFRYVSASSDRLFGYSPEEMTGASFFRFIYPGDIEKTIRVVADRTHDCKTSNFENRYVKKDGSVVPLIWSGRWDENDRLLYCVARDGSEKLEIEQRLLKAQQIAQVANFEYDVVNRQYTHVSDTLFDIFGLDKREHPQFTPELFWQHVHPDDLEKVRTSIQQPENHYTPALEYRIVRPNGTVAYIGRVREVVWNAAGKPIKAIGTIQDITERKIAELTLQQSEERFRHLAQNGNDMIGIIDAAGTYTFVGANIRSHLGYAPEDIVGKSAFDFIHPEDAGMAAGLLKNIKDRETLHTQPFRFMNSKGAWRWVETTASNHLHNPAINGLIVNSRDITDKKHYDDEMKASEQRFKALVQNGSDLIVVLDEKAHFTYVSDNVVNLLGYTPEEMLLRNAFDFIHTDDTEIAASGLFTLLHQITSASSVQHRFRHKNGGWVWLELKGSNHKGHHRINGILVNARNIDDRVNLQKKLDQEQVSKQREITSAIIKTQEQERSQLGLELHDNVNQVLTTVKLYNEMYLTGYVKDNELRLKSTQYLQNCIDEIRSISKRLSAPTLGKITLCDSINELVASINIAGKLKVDFTHNFSECASLSGDLHLAVYRIVQESINNIIKFSKATKVRVKIERQTSILLLLIVDNGTGFDTQAYKPGIGITNMKTRAEALNAGFKIKSAPSKGCRIQVSFPLN